MANHRPNNPFDILGLDHTASEADIKSAANGLLKVVHPDTSSNGAAAEFTVQEVKAARDELLEPERREYWKRDYIATRPHSGGYIEPPTQSALALRTDDVSLQVQQTEETSVGPSAQLYPFWGWTDAFLFLGVMVVLLVVMVVIASTLHLMGFIGMAPAAIVAQGLAMGLALLGLSRLFRIRYETRLRDALHLNAPRNVLRFVLFGLATAMMVAILGAVLKLSEMDMPMKELIRTDFDLLMVGIGAITFGPLFEELVFRGFLQPLFAKLVGAVPGIFATSLLFALPHGPQYGWHWQHLVVITAAGAVFGFIRWKTSSTTAAAIAHSAYNALLVSVAFLQRAYMLGN